MVSFNYSNVDDISKADIVLIGIPDESKSHSIRKSASKGPDILRFTSNETNFFKRNGEVIPICPMGGSIEGKNIFDYGNIERENLYDLVYNLISSNKIPIAIGGDHSITTIVLQAIGDFMGKIGLLYFDAHPDFVSSTTNYYGSVLTDAYKMIDFDKSLLIGIRSAEPEELENAYNANLEIVTPIDMNSLGLTRISEIIKSKSSTDKKYISIDLDCLDPAFAPGVSVPSPGGLSSLDLISLVKLVTSTGIIGLDIVELSPDYDINNMTAMLSARILLEAIASINIGEK